MVSSSAFRSASLPKVISLATVSLRWYSIATPPTSNTTVATIKPMRVRFRRFFNARCVRSSLRRNSSMLVAMTFISDSCSSSILARAVSLEWTSLRICSSLSRGRSPSLAAIMDLDLDLEEERTCGMERFFVGAVGGEGISGFAIVFVVVVVVAGGRFSCCLIDDATGALAVDDVPVQMVLRPEQPQQSHGAFPRPGAQGLQRLGMGRYPQRVAHLGHRLGRVGPSPLLLRLVGIGNGKEGLHPPDHDFVRLDEFRELKALDDRRGVPFFFSVSFLQPRQSFGPMPLLHLHQGRQKHD
mmetsp:Transcript_11135/g.21647  ORF Transcript_11135/g.21647 Transcript_11135/m.21647 type:complete len:298 (+) Transcript_11135:1151-2044(+)